MQNIENLMNDKYLRARDLKKIFLGIAQSTFGNWVKEGHIARYKIGGSVFYRYSEIQKMLENARIE